MNLDKRLNNFYELKKLIKELFYRVSRLEKASTAGFTGTQEILDGESNQIVLTYVNGIVTDIAT